MYTPIQLDKSRNLRYGMKALSLIEEKTGCAIANLDLDNMTVKLMATLIWAGLVHEDPALTPDSVMDLIDEHSNLVEISKAIQKAMINSFGKSEKN